MAGHLDQQHPDVSFTQTAGALAGFSFTFTNPGQGQTLKGTGSFTGSEEHAEEALKNAGFYERAADNHFNTLHCIPGTCDHFRTPGDPGTGENSAHFILQTWEYIQGLWGEPSLVPINPKAAVPRWTQFH